MNAELFDAGLADPFVAGFLLLRRKGLKTNFLLLVFVARFVQIGNSCRMDNWCRIHVAKMLASQAGELTDCRRRTSEFGI